MAKDQADVEYEAPGLVDLGSLADLTKGSGGIISGDLGLGINGFSILNIHF